MTISEFIYAFDEGSIYAEYDEQRNVYIYDNTYDTMMAQLGIDSSVWEVEDDTFTMSPSLLRLMAELADTPPAKRKGTPKYVILNGEPMKKWSGPHRNEEERTTTYSKYFNWCFFTIGNRGQYLVSHNTTDPEILTQCSYTREEVDETTKWLPEEWRNVINNLLTPLDVALEGRVKHDHME